MAGFSDVLYGTMEEVIRDVDMQVRKGKHALTYKEEKKITSSDMTVIMRIYEKFNVILRNTLSIIFLFVDKDNGKIEIFVFSSGDKYGIMQTDYGTGNKMIHTCQKKLKLLKMDN